MLSYPPKRMWVQTRGEDLWWKIDLKVAREELGGRKGLERGLSKCPSRLSVGLPLGSWSHG